MQISQKLILIPDHVINNAPFGEEESTRRFLPACYCRRILAVDDNDYNHMILARMLKKKGFEVVQAWNGNEAYAILVNSENHYTKCGLDSCRNFGILLTDLHMPILNGMDLIRKVRKLPPPLGEMPIILLSALDEKAEIKEGFDAGMDDYISKPFSEETLYQKLNLFISCLLYTSPSPRDRQKSRMPSSA
eukprot:TRINITY_DN1298_c0_g1_i5.p1 TRINITY_DN1298_c0_g1~~TRINITY_DN1298_c0_g1_i5.p1  ORF type:complete len:190 (+),score=28.11 TRINITY_DN1298_c0_g1_i5:324-893(+)